MTNELERKDFSFKKILFLPLHVIQIFPIRICFVMYIDDTYWSLYLTLLGFCSSYERSFFLFFSFLVLLGWTLTLSLSLSWQWSSFKMYEYDVQCENDLSSTKERRAYSNQRVSGHTKLKYLLNESRACECIVLFDVRWRDIFSRVFLPYYNSL
jgi:hypothetical protein